MQADALNPRDLFDGNVQYEIPAFQRPYVWNEEDQWAPLWADIERVALKVAAADLEALEPPKHPTHFLGAVVVKSTAPDAGSVTRHSVIDGQQRMTTLQLLLDAARVVLDELKYEDEAEALGELVRNGSRRFATKQERFKLWPCRTDRSAFVSAMEPNTEDIDPGSLVGEAHNFFQKSVRGWLMAEEEAEDIKLSQDGRVAVLARVLQSHLYLVSINLGMEDDDQVIFETLNDRGTPLLAADLIKNWVFQRGEAIQANTDNWADNLWLEFDDDWWRETISQGRHLRSRIDIFLQYWLTMRTKAEVLSESIFNTFREHASKEMTAAATAEAFLHELRGDAATFRGFAELDSASPSGQFYSRVVVNLELAATTPVLLWMVSKNHNVPSDQIMGGLLALESWVVRRTMLRYTMKDVNRLMVSLLNDLDVTETSLAGTTIRNFLAGQTANSRLWPTDEEIVEDLPQVKLYGNVRQARLRVVLEGIEMSLRTKRHEAIDLPPRLEIEHIMPQGWRTHWNSNPPLSEREMLNRDALVSSIGNLTMVTKKLNGSLSHRPWTDNAASRTTANDGPALGKHSLLSEYSLLAMNREVVAEHADGWTEADILKRGTSMAERLCSVWPR